MNFTIVAQGLIYQCRCPGGVDAPAITRKTRFGLLSGEGGLLPLDLQIEVSHKVGPLDPFPPCIVTSITFNHDRNAGSLTNQGFRTPDDTTGLVTNDEHKTMSEDDIHTLRTTPATNHSHDRPPIDERNERA